MYVTRELSLDRNLKQKVEELEFKKDSLDNSMKLLISRTLEKDREILEQIKLSYEQIDLLATQKKGVHDNIGRQQETLDSLINEIIKENKKYETQ